MRDEPREGTSPSGVRSGRVFEKREFAFDEELVVVVVVVAREDEALLLLFS